MKNSTSLPIIAALDEISPDLVPGFLKNEIPEISIIKIGLEVFNLSGKSYIENLEKSLGIDYFLDLKLHDIPNTVYNAIKSLAGLSPKFLTIHLSGGIEMIQKALEARDRYLKSTQIIGVSYLTSLSEQNFANIWGVDKNTLLEKIGRVAKNSGIDGVVCSAKDIKIIKPFLDDQKIITPGIRLEGSKHGDQSRVTTPTKALTLGSDYLVIGRPLRNKIEKALVINQVKDFYFSQ